MIFTANKCSTPSNCSAPNRRTYLCMLCVRRKLFFQMLQNLWNSPIQALQRKQNWRADLTQHRENDKPARCVVGGEGEREAKWNLLPAQRAALPSGREQWQKLLCYSAGPRSWLAPGCSCWEAAGPAAEPWYCKGHETPTFHLLFRSKFSACRRFSCRKDLLIHKTLTSLVWPNVSRGECVFERAVNSEPSWHLCAGAELRRDWPLPVHPPYGRGLGKADLDQLRQTVLPVQDVRVLQSVHQFVCSLTLCRPLLNQRLNAQRSQVLQHKRTKTSIISKRRKKKKSLNLNLIVITKVKTNVETNLISKFVANNVQEWCHIPLNLL